MAERPQLELGNYLPYLINRVGFALVESFTAAALTLYASTTDANPPFHYSVVNLGAGA